MTWLFNGVNVVTVETPGVVHPSLDTELDLRTAGLGAVHELVKIGPGTLGLPQMVFPKFAFHLFEAFPPERLSAD